MNSHIITLVRDPHHTLGKKFTINPDGGVSKRSSVNVSLGVAIMHQVNTHEELAALLKEVGEDANAAIINASFDGIDIGEEFLILSGQEIEKRIGISRDNREQQKGVHRVMHNGREYKALARYKENVRPSCWQYFDRDIDEHTPDHFKNISTDEWLVALDKMLPGIGIISYVRAGSTSSRVCRSGIPVGSGNGHLWIKVANPSDIERFRTVMIIAAAQAGMTWLKPRYNRSDSNTVVGKSLTTIIDTSVWTSGRLVFIGKPIVSDGLTVESLPVSVHHGESAMFDTESIPLPDKHIIKEVTRKVGIQMSVSNGGSGLRITVSDLTLDTEIETDGHGLLTVRKIVEQGMSEKIRCQTPFRESSSYAAFISIGTDGKPFVYDVGTGVTHWLNDFSVEEFEIIKATGITRRLLDKVTNDCGAPFEAEAIHALSIIRDQKPADFQRIRTELKRVNKDLSLGALDREIKSHSADNNVAMTHHGYASDIIEKLTIGEHAPIGYAGDLYIVDPGEGIWAKCPVETIIRLVAYEHDGKENCERSSDYSGIAQHAIMLATGNGSFENAPIGLACPGGFYQIKDNVVSVEPLSPSQLQRVKISVDPEVMETPLFNNFMHEAFESSIPGEEAHQLTLVQEIVGGIMFGIMARYQKACLLYEPFGRAGKGVFVNIITQLVPKTFVTAVSPFNWGNEYYLATLVGSRLNVVGELPDNKSIPAAAFKTVTGGDLITGRHPTHRPIVFTNEAAHLFMSNHLINTVDHSEAFFARWLMIDFPNSRTKSGKPIDPGLADRIIKKELSGIAHWAMLGAQRLMANGSFSISPAHNRLMEKWRRNSNSLEEFIFESCELENKAYIRRSNFYQEYKTWCGDNGRHHFAKGKVKELLANNIGLGITWSTLDGHEIFRGVCMNSENVNHFDISL